MLLSKLSKNHSHQNTPNFHLFVRKKAPTLKARFMKANVDDRFKEERHHVLPLLYSCRFLGCDCPISCKRIVDANEKEMRGREQSSLEKDGRFRKLLHWVYHSIVAGSRASQEGMMAIHKIIPVIKTMVNTY